MQWQIMPLYYKYSNMIKVTFMKKIIALLLLAALIATFAACTPQDGDTSSAPADTSSEASGTPYSPSTPPVPDESEESSDESSAESSEPDVSEESDTSSSTPTPSDIGKVDYSHTFSTDYGCYCDLVTDVTVISSSELDVSVTVDVKLVCYSISASARNNSGTVIIGDKKFAYSTPALENYDGKIAFDFVTQSRTLTRNSDGTLTFDVGATWPFNGNYNGVEIGVMEAIGKIIIAADGSVTLG